jgi:hypothetical protein
MRGDGGLDQRGMAEGELLDEHRPLGAADQLQQRHYAVVGLHQDPGTVPKGAHHPPPVSGSPMPQRLGRLIIAAFCTCLPRNRNDGDGGP